MASGAEMVRKPEKPSFSFTCSLLSQYIKGKGGLADVGLGMPTCVHDSGHGGKMTPTTMRLLPGVDVSGDDLADLKDEISPQNVSKFMELFPHSAASPTVEAKEPEKAQLTIFYGGRMVVFDNFPASKANDLMQLASKAQNFTSGTQISSSAVSGVSPVANVMTYPSPALTPESFTARAQPNFSDLPIARKASLHRFLEKRKNRICSKAPYQLDSSSGTKDAEAVKEEEISQPWLGLGPHASMN